MRAGVALALGLRLVSLTDVLGVFRPNTEMDDPALFAGRASQIESAALALHAEGSCPIIFGARGLGKSSLARQLQRIAQGDVELLEDYGLQELSVRESDRFVAFFVPCTDAVATLEDLLQRMVNALLEVEVVRDTELVETTTFMRLTLPGLAAGFEDKFAADQLRAEYGVLSLEEQVLAIAGRLAEAACARVLFIVDELDRVDVAGLASFVKAASSDWLKFALVGIANDMSELLEDHASVERILWPIEITRMGHGELRQIVVQADERLAQLGISLSSTESAKNVLSTVSAGFPWFVHLLGQECYVAAFRNSVDVVDAAEVEVAVASLAKNKFSQNFRDRYQKAVRDSYNREIVLRAFAAWGGHDIPTKDVYAVAETLGVSNPSVYRGHLVQEQYGSVLLTPAFQQRGVVRFENEMFKIYCRLAGSLYEGVDAAVDTAWKNRSAT